MSKPIDAAGPSAGVLPHAPSPTVIAKHDQWQTIAYRNLTKLIASGQVDVARNPVLAALDRNFDGRIEPSEFSEGLENGTSVSKDFMHQASKGEFVFHPERVSPQGQTRAKMAQELENAITKMAIDAFEQTLRQIESS